MHGSDKYIDPNPTTPPKPFQKFNSVPSCGGVIVGFVKVHIKRARSLSQVIRYKSWPQPNPPSGPLLGFLLRIL